MITRCTRYLKASLWMLFFSLVTCTGVLAQSSTGTVEGVVQDQNGQPVQNVSVIAENSKTNFKRGTLTDSLGMFRFTALPAGNGYKLTFSHVQYDIQTMNDYNVKMGTNPPLTMKLKGRADQLNEVVVVGYSTQKKINLTGAVSQVSGDVLNARSLPNITQGLQGAIPNLNLVMADGKPFTSPTYNIRGTTSIGQGGSALVLIDGVQGDPSLLNPNDVASVTVLKDVSSAAVYGARAAYGVVLITTKNPKKDKFNITYSSNYSLKQPTTVPQTVSDGYQYALMFDSAWSAWNDYAARPQNVNKTQVFSPAYLAELKRRDEDPSLPKVEVDPTTGNYVYYSNVDWYDLLYKNNLGAIDQNLSVSGSNSKTSYYVTGRYYGQDGLFRYNPDDYSMYNLMAKGTLQVTPWLQIYNTTQFSSRKYHNPVNVGEGGGIWRNMADNSHPSTPLFNPDGTLTSAGAYSVGDFWYGKNGIDFKDQVTKNTSGFIANIYKNVFQIRGDFTFQNTVSNQTQIRVPVPYSLGPGVINYLGSQYNDISMTNSNNNYLAANVYGEYENTFAHNHYLKVLLGYNYEQSVTSGYTALRNGLIFSDADNINLALGQNTATSGVYEKWAILGGFGRINYSFKDRYLIEGDARYDGSSKFPSDQRFAFFPSVSAGWRVSKESFWHVSPKAISDLKIRASYGSLGNGNIASYAYQEQFGISQSSRVLGGVLPQYTSAPGVLPAGLTWETATTANLGLDLTLLSNRLEFTGDMYNRKTTNMFTVGQTLPDVFGATVPKGNYADMTTKGWEVSLAWRDQFKMGGSTFSYHISAWMSDYTAKITKYNNATGTLNDYYAGETVGEIWGYTNDGYWTDADVAKAKDFQNFIKVSNSNIYLPGDIKFKDINGDGVINNGAYTVSDHGDLKVIGNSTPRYTYGINLGADYHNFFFSAFFQGVGKMDWWPGSEADAFWGQYNRPYDFLMQSQVGKIWSPSNPNAYWPRYRGYVAQNTNRELYVAQTKYLQNVSYIRLKNIQVGYNLPAGLISRLHMNSARVYLSGENLWSASPLYKITKDFDVENIGRSDTIASGSNSGNTNNYPILKSVTIGLSVTF
ncbi:MAG TPA: SusC/RagA family TonB-linked outer membrane protein [Chitinophagaceae bacterium]|nr:SusC/RagA family TonB-linked outer membrane protein [Chitinophagaceae bacterium]